MNKLLLKAYIESASETAYTFLSIFNEPAVLSKIDPLLIK